MVYLFKQEDNNLYNTAAHVEKNPKKHCPDSIYLLRRQSCIHAYSNIYLHVEKFSPAC